MTKGPGEDPDRPLQFWSLVRKAGAFIRAKHQSVYFFLSPSFSLFSPLVPGITHPLSPRLGPHVVFSQASAIISTIWLNFLGNCNVIMHLCGEDIKSHDCSFHWTFFVPCTLCRAQKKQKQQRVLWLLLHQWKDSYFKNNDIRLSLFYLKTCL